MSVNSFRVNDEDARLYDMYANGYMLDIKNRRYKNAKDWFESMMKLDERLAQKGEP